MQHAVALSSWPLILHARQERQMLRVGWVASTAAVPSECGGGDVLSEEPRLVRLGPRHVLFCAPGLTGEAVASSAGLVGAINRLGQET